MGTRSFRAVYSPAEALRWHLEILLNFEACGHILIISEVELGAPVCSGDNRLKPILTQGGHNTWNCTERSFL